VASSLVISAAETTSCSDHEGASQDRKRGPSQGVAEEIVKQPKQTPAQLAGERKTKFASDKDGLLSSFIYCFYLPFSYSRAFAVAYKIFSSAHIRESRKDVGGRPTKGRGSRRPRGVPAIGSLGSTAKLSLI